MQAIVVDDDAVAAACIDYLKKTRAGRATFLPLNKMLVGRPRGKAILVAKESVGFAIDLIRFDEKYRDAFFYVLGDTIVVETLDQARKYMGGVRLVTLGGGLIEARAAMIGGDLEKTPLRFGAPDRREIDTVSEKLRKATEESERVTKRLAELRKEVVALETELKDVGGQTSTVDVKASALETKRREFTTKVTAIREDLEAKQKKLTETEKTAKRVKEFESSLQKLENEIRGLERMEANMSKEMQGLQGDRDAAYKEKTEVEGEIDKLGHKLETKEDFATNLQTELRAQEESLAKAIEELKSLGREIAGKLPPLDELKRTIGDSETQIQALGPINMRALDDYDAQEKRYAELTDEFAKLGTQRQELINLVLELTERKKEGLGTVFTAINENFKRVYKEISEGGEAELLLENEKDPFTGGLIIHANPSHKKVLRLEALSGGEKSLVSMAFIFAIQEYDPSPFYLLDEIDQNLDAVNAERVARMIRRNSSTAQFVQISLRKISLKEADHLVGVTMTPESLSEVIMRVNLADVEDEKPTEAIPA